MGQWWYQGLWRVSVEYKCYRHTDGKKINLPEQKFYMVLTPEYDYYLGEPTIKPNGYGGYWATFYRDKGLSQYIGGASLDFDYPSYGEIYLLDGEGEKRVYVKGELWGNCNFELQRVLKTFVNRANEGMNESEMNKLRRGSEIKGWDLSRCYQYLDYS